LQNIYEWKMSHHLFSDYSKKTPGKMFENNAGKSGT